MTFPVAAKRSVFAIIVLAISIAGCSDGGAGSGFGPAPAAGTGTLSATLIGISSDPYPFKTSSVPSSRDSTVIYIDARATGGQYGEIKIRLCCATTAGTFALGGRENYASYEVFSTSVPNPPLTTFGTTGASGMVTLTYLSATRAVGTFSFLIPAVNTPGFSSGALSATGGSFDVSFGPD